jgi:hypothetical protein
VSSLFKQNNFPLFGNLGLIEKIKSKVVSSPCLDSSEVKQRISAILQFEIIPHHNNIMSIQKQTNMKFKEMHKILESLA